MKDKKDSKKTEGLEREYVIPLRKEWAKVPRYKRAGKAIKAIKEFLVQHMKIRERDLNRIKIDKYVNEEIWHRGIKKPPIKIKVKAKIEGDIVRVELVDYVDKLKFKKAREEKILNEGKKKAKEKKEDAQDSKNLGAEESKAAPSRDVSKQDSAGKSEEEIEEEKKKIKSGEEGMKKIEKQTAKTMKHEAVGKIKEQKHQVRKALAK